MPSEATDVARSNGQFNCKYQTCDRYGQEVCLQCNEPFCPDHASQIDPKFCASCLSPQSIEIQKEPLKDDDGVTHNGAHLTPVGSSFKSLAKRITEMTDEQLRLHIQHVRTQVKEAEAVLDYRRVDLSSSEVEIEQRQILENKKLRGVKVNLGKIQVIATGGVGKDVPKKTQSGVEFLSALMKMCNIPVTPENITKFASKLAEQKKPNGK